MADPTPVNLFEQAMKLRQAADTLGWMLEEIRHGHGLNESPMAVLRGYLDAGDVACLVLRGVAEDLICPRRVVEREAVRAPETGQGPAIQQTVDRRPEAIWGKDWPERPGRWLVELEEQG